MSDMANSILANGEGAIVCRVVFFSAGIFSMLPLRHAAVSAGAGSDPVLDFHARIDGEIPFVIGHQHHIQRYRMRCDQFVEMVFPALAGRLPRKCKYTCLQDILCTSKDSLGMCIYTIRLFLF